MITQVTFGTLVLKASKEIHGNFTFKNRSKIVVSLATRRTPSTVAQ